MFCFQGLCTFDPHHPLHAHSCSFNSAFIIYLLDYYRSLLIGLPAASFLPVHHQLTPKVIVLKLEFNQITFRIPLT